MPQPAKPQPLREVLKQLFPNQCLLCGQPGQTTCKPCLAGLPWLEHCCQRCALPLSSRAELCAHCLREPPVFQHCLCLWRYEFPINGLIQRFKYQANRDARTFLETQLGRAVGIYLAQCDRAYDAVLAVPSHPLRRFRRGYNPSYQLAKAVSQYCQCPHIQALGKSRWSHSQQGLNRKQRLKNLSGSFSVHGPVAGQRLLLIDDVMTTATTANVISELLLNHGATSVDIAYLARTPRHMSS